MPSNKEVLDKLYEYYLDQDPKLIAFAFANAMIDYHRLTYPRRLNREETLRHWQRIERNGRCVEHFVNNGMTYLDEELSMGKLGFGNDHNAPRYTHTDTHQWGEPERIGSSNIIEWNKNDQKTIE